ncbi:hypothetical protein Zmor_015334 [Zophobas morio]|uniref:Adenylate cyclase N-terminal domain-containing protein n=1 Tax=Zophobas morio TaxID=2755281 RepID=A0AA38MHN6_9CUCU|nr:hypothetical protein Zmor_015334 [Zophobas morio]
MNIYSSSFNKACSGTPIATSASKLFFSERRPAAVTDDESPIIATHTRKLISVVPGRHMGLFCNNIDTSTVRRGCGRRWTSLKQHPRSCTEPLTETGNSSGLSTPSTANTSPLPAAAGESTRKSNWQVIEHFGSKDNKGSLSSSLIAVGSVSRTPPTKENGSAPNSSPDLEGHEVEAELLVSSAPKASMGFFGKLLRLIKKLFSTHQFQNEQVEMLYQRYFLKMNQSNMTNLISLLLLLCVGFLLFAATDLVMVHHSETDLPQEHSKRLEKLLVLIGTSGCCIAIYGVLLAVLSKPAMNEVYLIIISYFILVTFLTLEVEVSKQLLDKVLRKCLLCVEDGLCRG